MKTIGIIGGLGPPSTVKYYQWLNEGVNAALGGHHFAKILLTSVDGDQIRQFREVGDVEAEGQFFAREATRLEAAGAELILIASNTSHRNADDVTSAVEIPLIHIAEVTALRLQESGHATVGLIGTALTMETDFYRSRLAARGIEVLTPSMQDRAYLTSVIYGDLVKDHVPPGARDDVTRIIHDLADAGAQAVVLGCTELTLLELPDNIVPLFDTTRLHVEAALAAALP